MSFWSSIKKEVSRVGSKWGFDRSSKSWMTTAVGTAVGTIGGAVAGSIVGGPAGAWVGGIAGGSVGAVAGAGTGDQMDAIEASNERAAEQTERAIAMASRTEMELTDNNTESDTLDEMDEERRARLASAYSLSSTRAAFTKSTASTGGRRKTLG